MELVEPARGALKRTRTMGKAPGKREFSMRGLNRDAQGALPLCERSEVGCQSRGAKGYLNEYFRHHRCFDYSCGGLWIYQLSVSAASSHHRHFKHCPSKFPIRACG